MVIITEGDSYRMREVRTIGGRRTTTPNPPRPTRRLSLATTGDFHLAIDMSCPEHLSIS